MRALIVPVEFDWFLIEGFEGSSRNWRTIVCPFQLRNMIGEGWEKSDGPENGAKGDRILWIEMGIIFYLL